MQPANLHLDPMANLWSSSGSPNSNNYFSQPSSGSPGDQTAGTTSSGQSRPSDGSYDMSGNFYASPQQNGQAQTQAGPDAGAGDTFMGASTPGPSGVGIGGWKWTVLDGKQQ